MRPLRLLHEVQAGNRAALDELFPLVYDELRRLAHNQRRGWHGNETINTTALVHEAYLKLVRINEVDWQDRAHFMAVAARAMRRVLVGLTLLLAFAAGCVAGFLPLCMYGSPPAGRAENRQSTAGRELSRRSWWARMLSRHVNPRQIRAKSL